MSVPRPLVLIVQWFGPWPDWINFFVESCKWNKDVDWLVITDQRPPDNRAGNVRYRHASFATHVEFIGERIGIRLAASEPYKACDFKPCLGFAYEDEIAGYANFGYCDLDVIFGNIRAFYTDDLLQRYDVLSTHERRLSGHLTVLRNDSLHRNAFRRIRHWRRKVASPRHTALDEKRFGTVFTQPSLWSRLTEPRAHVLLEERYSTPWSRRPWLDGTYQYPERWFWKHGALTAEGYGDRQFLYLHFMNLKSDRFRDQEKYGAAPWPRLNQIVGMNWRQAAQEGFMISAEGFTPLPLSRK